MYSKQFVPIQNFNHFLCTPKLLDGLTTSSKMKIVKEGIGARSLACNTSGVKGCAKALRQGLIRLTSKSITHTNLHKPNNKFVNVELEHFWCINEPRANTDPQDSSWSRLAGNHHLPPYSIFYAWPQDQHPNVILSRDSKVGVLKFPKLGLPNFGSP